MLRSVSATVSRQRTYTNVPSKYPIQRGQTFHGSIVRRLPHHYGLSGTDEFCIRTTVGECLQSRTPAGLCDAIRELICLRVPEKLCELYLAQS